MTKFACDRTHCNFSSLQSLQSLSPLTSLFARIFDFVFSQQASGSQILWAFGPRMTPYRVHKSRAALAYSNHASSGWYACHSTPVLPSPGRESFCRRSIGQFPSPSVLNLAPWMAPATKFALQGSTKYCACHSRPRSTAPATKSALQGPQSTAPASKLALQPTKYCACHEMCTSRCTCHEITHLPPLDYQNTRFPLRLPREMITSSKKRTEPQRERARREISGRSFSASLRSQNARAQRAYPDRTRALTPIP